MLVQIKEILEANKFKDVTDRDTKRRTNSKLYFKRGIYTLNLDDTGGGVILEIFKNNSFKDRILCTSMDLFYGLFAYLKLSSFQKKSIDGKLLHLFEYYTELINDYNKELTSGQRQFKKYYNEFIK